MDLNHCSGCTNDFLDYLINILKRKEDKVIISTITKKINRLRKG